MRRGIRISRIVLILMSIFPAIKLNGITPTNKLRNCLLLILETKLILKKRIYLIHELFRLKKRYFCKIYNYIFMKNF